MQRSVQTKLDACMERIGQMHAALAVLAADIGELAGLIATMRAPDEKDALQELLNRHQAEIIRLLTIGQEAPCDGDERLKQGPRGFPFRLDPVKREVRIGRRQVSLTPREFQVVELLWEQMPLAVSREAMLERLYGARRGRSERVVDVHVYNVRQKLRMAGATDAAIRSKTGEGWRLDLKLPNGSGDVNARLAGETVGPP